MTTRLPTAVLGLGCTAVLLIAGSAVAQSLTPTSGSRDDARRADRGRDAAVVASGLSDCCVENGSPGCSDATCEALICGADAFCCDVEWDNICADAAEANCGVCMDGGGGDCTVTVAITLDDFGDETTWDLSDENGPVASGGPYGTEPGGTVVGGDFGVTGAWTFTIFDSFGDGICCGFGLGSYTILQDGATVCTGGEFAAQDSCSGACDGGGGGEVSDCCSVNGTPGCDDADCEALICAADPFCCDVTWDEICANLALDLCLVCAPEEGNCTVTVAITLDDFGSETSWELIDVDGPVASGGPYADGTGGTVVGGDFLVTGAWTFIIADSFGDGICCGFGLGGYEILQDGALVCAGGEFTDIDTCEGTCIDFDAEGDCCVSNGTPGCEDIDCQLLICGADPFCCDVTWDEICASAAEASCGACGDEVDCNDNEIPDADEVEPEPTADERDGQEDFCGDAAHIGPGVWAGTTEGATNDAGLVSCESQIGLFDVWYRYRPAWTGVVSINFYPSEMDVTIHVYTACPEADAPYIACAAAPDTNAIFLAERKKDYWFRIAGIGAATGDFTLSLIGPDGAPSLADCNGNGIPDDCECLADVNGDGSVDVGDLIAVYAQLGQACACPADVDGDGIVDDEDAVVVLNSYGDCPLPAAEAVRGGERQVPKRRKSDVIAPQGTIPNRAF